MIAARRQTGLCRHRRAHLEHRPGALEAAITPHAPAIMPVSLYGQCADMAAINRVAEARTACQ